MELTLTKKEKGLKIYCKDCRKEFSSIPPCVKSRHKRLDQVEHRYAYKAVVHVPLTKNEKRVKILTAINEKDAIKELWEFQKELKATGFEKKNFQPQGSQMRNSKPNPDTVLEWIDKYINFINDIDVPDHQIKKLSKGHKEDIEKELKFFCKTLNEHNVSAYIPIKSIGETHVGLIYTALKNRPGKDGNIKGKTFNKVIGYYSTFFNYLIKKGAVNANFFEGLSRPIKRSKPKLITSVEFKSVLKQIDEGPSHIVFKNGKKKNMKFPYLKNGISMMLYTGRRRDDIVLVRWSDVYPSTEGGLIGGYILFENHKVNRKNNAETKEEKEFVKVFINKPLEDLLITMEYGKFQGSNNYILAPFEKKLRKTILNDLSKGFSHFYKQLNTGVVKTLKDTRKTFDSLAYTIDPAYAHISSGHLDPRTLINHYVAEEVKEDRSKKISMNMNFDSL